MGRVNFAKGNRVFLSCLSWSHQQPGEVASFFFLSSLWEVGLMEIGIQKKDPNPTAVPPKKEKNWQLCFMLPVWPLPLVEQLKWVLARCLGKLTRQEAACYGQRANSSFFSGPTGINRWASQTFFFLKHKKFLMVKQCWQAWDLIKLWFNSKSVKLLWGGTEMSFLYAEFSRLWNAIFLEFSTANSCRNNQALTSVTYQVASLMRGMAQLTYPHVTI